MSNNKIGDVTPYRDAATGQILTGIIKNIYYTTVVTSGYYSYYTEPAYAIPVVDPNIGWNGSARSIDSIQYDGTATFQIRVDTVGAVVGLNDVSKKLASGYMDIPYGILFTKGLFSVVENGIVKTGKVSFGAYDYFSIARSNEDIFYLVNDVVFYKSRIPSIDQELSIDASLYIAQDAIIYATIDSTTLIDQAVADTILVSTSVYAQPKAVAQISAKSTVSFNGVYSNQDGYHSSAAIAGQSNLNILTQFGGYPAIVAQAYIDLVYPYTETGISANLGAMTASLTSGYISYTEVNASLPPMEANATMNGITVDLNLLNGYFPPLGINAHCLTGQTTLASTMPLRSLSAFGADRAYAEIIVSFNPMINFAGQNPDLGNYGLISFITPTLLVSGHSSDLNSGTLTFIDSTIEGYGGAITEEEAINFIDLSTFSCTGTHLNYGNANIAFSTFTLSSTGIGYGTSNTAIGFIRSTITSFGGANAAIAAPVFTLASTGSYIPLGKASLDFLTWSVSSTGHLDANGSATIGFPTFTSIWGSSVLPAPFLNLAATGSVVITNSVAYVLNIVTNESTRYTNQIWDHIVVLGNKPYGVTSTGLYLLEGATDNGVAIDTYMATKETDLGTNMAKSIPTIYLNSDTQTYTTAYMDGVAQTPQASSFSGRKCHLSRGAEARYVKLKISGVKNLQGLEILPEIKSRRVK